MHQASSRYIIPLKPSVSFGLGSRLSPVDLELRIETEQIINIIKHTIHKLDLVLCLPMLIEDEGEFIRPYLSEEELSFVLNACAKYTSRDSESSSMKGSREGSEGTYDSKSLEGSLTSDSQTHEEQSESKLKKSTSTLKRKSKPSKTIVEEREDINMWKAIKLLYEKPEIRMKIKESETQISSAASAFMDYFKRFQDFALHHLTTSARRQEAEELGLRRKWYQNERAKEEIEQLKIKLEQGKSGLDMRLKAKSILIFFNRARMKRMNRECKDDIKKRIYESERQQITYWKESELRQIAMNQEIGDLETKMATLLKTDLKDEKDLRARKLKAEMQLVSWLNKYDADIGEKQAEYDEIMTGFEEEKKQMEELQEQFDIQNEQYTQLMQEKEDEERAIFEEKMYIFICNRSARRIQRYWRAYRARKLARKKARRQKKGGKGKKGKKK